MSQYFIYQSEQIREIENLAVQSCLSKYELMERAGSSAFAYLKICWPKAKRLTIFCGSGNNGGDGYVLAKCAEKAGLTVTIYQMGHHEPKTEEAKLAYQACLGTKIVISSVKTALSSIKDPIIVDAICGIGLKNDLHEDVKTIVNQLNQLNIPILSLDVPTGIEADTGRRLGASIKATATITFIGLKLGLLTGTGIDDVGTLHCDDLNLSKIISHSHIKPLAEKINLTHYSNYLPRRKANWHKGLSGHVLIVGGDSGYMGSVTLAGMAALRTGAGITSIATREAHAALISSTYPESMCHGIIEKNGLAQLLSRAKVVVLGPGLGVSPWAINLYSQVIDTSLPIILDADGLNLLAENPLKKENWILTPHPGEAARLLKTSVSAIQDNRLAALKAIEQQYGGVCVLKGAGSMIAANSKVLLCAEGNPGMASAGMGDVLSGIIAGFVAQGVPLKEAAILGVSLHAQAGDEASLEGEYGMIASDLFPHLRRILNLARR